MDLRMNRHEILSSLASIILVFGLIGGGLMIVLGFIGRDWWLVGYGISTGFGSIVSSAVLEWMRSVYVALYNLNRISQQPAQPPAR